MTKNRSCVIIFKMRMLEYSETFVIEQAKHLDRFNFKFLCFRRVKNGLEIENSRIKVLFENSLSKLYEILFILNVSRNSLTNYLRGQKFVLVHAHFGVDSYFLLDAKKSLNFPLITTFHGYDITVDEKSAKKSFLAHKVFSKYKVRLASEGDCFIAVSNFIKAKLIENNFPSSKIRVHYIGVDTEKFYPKIRDLNLRKILFVGRLVEKKGVFDLLKAYKKVQDKFEDVELSIVGDGPLRREAENYVLNNSLRKVVFKGKLAQKEVIDEIGSSTIFCVPSKTAVNGDSEAFGIVFIEAQSMGIPVVSYNHGGISEAVKHGKTGLLAPEGDTEQLANNIIELLGDSDLNSTFSSAARERVLRKFEIKKQCEKLEQIYSEIAKDYRK